MTKTALILVDIQNDYFDGGDWPVTQMDKVADNARRLLEAARERGWLVIHVRHEFPTDKAPFFRPGTTGAQIHDTVAPRDGERIIVKQRPNSFHQTSLLADLQDGGIDHVAICGAMSQMCIDATARAAADFGFAVTVVEDACGARPASFLDRTVAAADVHAAYMASLASSYGKVLTTEAFIGASDDA